MFRFRNPSIFALLIVLFASVLYRTVLRAETPGAEKLPADPQIAAALKQVSVQRIQANIEKLVSFQTRLTLSATRTSSASPRVARRRSSEGRRRRRRRRIRTRGGELRGRCSTGDVSGRVDGGHAERVARAAGQAAEDIRRHQRGIDLRPVVEDAVAGTPTSSVEAVQESETELDALGGRGLSESTEASCWRARARRLRQ